MNAYQKNQEKVKSGNAPDSGAFREKEKKYEEEIRNLKRRVDEAEFAAEKSRKEGDFNLNMYRTSQESEMKRLLADKDRITIRCREAEGRLAQIER